MSVSSLGFLRLVSLSLALLACAKPPAPEAPTVAKAADPVPTTHANESSASTANDDASDGCNAKKCRGNVGPQLETALTYRAKQAHRCYDNALATKPTIQGRVAVDVRVAADGGVCSATAKSSDDGMDSVAACVANYFRSGGFGAPEGGCADVMIPINFVPRP